MEQWNISKENAGRSFPGKLITSVGLMLLVEFRFGCIETQRAPRDLGSSLVDLSRTWTAIGQFLGAWQPCRAGL